MSLLPLRDYDAASKPRVIRRLVQNVTFPLSQCTQASVVGKETAAREARINYCAGNIYSSFSLNSLYLFMKHQIVTVLFSYEAHLFVTQTEGRKNRNIPISDSREEIKTQNASCDVGA